MPYRFRLQNIENALSLFNPTFLFRPTADYGEANRREQHQEYEDNAELKEGEQQSKSNDQSFQYRKREQNHHRQYQSSSNSQNSHDDDYSCDPYF